MFAEFMKKVTKLEFEEHLLKFENLEIHMVTIREPHLKTYNDFSEGKQYPDSIVASVSLNEDYGEENEYYVKETE